MKVIVSLIDGKWRFFVVDKRCYFSSSDIAKCFNISLEDYENRVVNNVIKHKDFEVTFASNPNKRNIAFEANDILEDTYVERFKEEFVREMISLTLSGEEII